MDEMNSLVKRETTELVPVKLPEEHQRFYDKLRAKMERFIKEKGVNDQISQVILLAPDLFVLLARLMVDKRVPLEAKAIVGLAVTYFISPIDLIPELVAGPLGMVDDVVLAVYALRKILLDVDQSIVLEHWNGKQNLLDVISSVVKTADELVGQNMVTKLKELLFSKAKKK
ncbi:YkvA family protein [Brevibacillus fluminis]|uniref:YkvA family protein n=1 Tax=Brevibacillus fluminis TaxID=511487 RepID=UPI003F8AB897